MIDAAQENILHLSEVGGLHSLSFKLMLPKPSSGPTVLDEQLLHGLSECVHGLAGQSRRVHQVRVHLTIV